MNEDRTRSQQLSFGDFYRISSKRLKPEETACFMHISLECSLTGEVHDPSRLQGLSKVGKPLLARYDLHALREKFTPQIVRKRTDRSMWRFHDVLAREWAD